MCCQAAVTTAAVTLTLKGYNCTGCVVAAAEEQPTSETGGDMWGNETSLEEKGSQTRTTSFKGTKVGLFLSSGNQNI